MLPPAILHGVLLHGPVPELQAIEKMTYKPIDPLDAHDCTHCRRLFLELDGRRKTYRCSLTHEGVIPNQPNDCPFWDSTWLSDFKRKLTAK